MTVVSKVAGLAPRAATGSVGEDGWQVILSPLRANAMMELKLQFQGELTDLKAGEIVDAVLSTPAYVEALERFKKATDQQPTEIVALAEEKFVGEFKPILSGELPSFLQTSEERGFDPGFLREIQKVLPSLVPRKREEEKA